MALEVFDFDKHSFETENPESSLRVQLGGSYTFTAPPTDPDQRTITLDFAAMKYFLNEDGSLNDVNNPSINMFRLIKFYQRHKMYKSFQYNHPVHGLMEVKFNKPLKEPAVLSGGFGVVKAFSIELIEIP